MDKFSEHTLQPIEMCWFFGSTKSYLGADCFNTKKQIKVD